MKHSGVSSILKGRRGEETVTVRSLEVEWETMGLAKARNLGLTDKWYMLEASNTPGFKKSKQKA